MDLVTKLILTPQGKGPIERNSSDESHPNVNLVK